MLLGGRHASDDVSRASPSRQQALSLGARVTGDELCARGGLMRYVTMDFKASDWWSITFRKFAVRGRRSAVSQSAKMSNSDIYTVGELNCDIYGRCAYCVSRDTYLVRHRQLQTHGPTHARKVCFPHRSNSLTLSN